MASPQGPAAGGGGVAAAGIGTVIPSCAVVFPQQSRANPTQAPAVSRPGLIPTSPDAGPACFLAQGETHCGHQHPGGRARRQRRPLRPHRAPVTATHGRARGRGGGTRGGAGPRLSPAAAERTVLYLQAPRENVCGSGSGRGVCGTACRAPSRASRARRRSRRPSRAPPPRGDAAAPSRGAQPFRAEPSAACSARAQAQRAPRLPPSRRKPDNQLWRRMASAPACHAPKEVRGAGKAGRGSSISLHAARTEQTAGPPPCMAEEAPPPLAHCRQSLLLGHQKSSY